ISRRDGLDRVLAGIAAARRVGFEKIRLNAVAIRSLSEPDLIPLAHFARQHQLELRFIEYMPLDADGQWQAGQVLDGEEIRARLASQFGPLAPLLSIHPSQPARDYAYEDGQGIVGFINSVTQ